MDPLPVGGFNSSWEFQRVMFLYGAALLLLCQSLGEGIARLGNLSLPGPVIGLMLLVLLLRWEPVKVGAKAAADGLLAHLSLLYVPVGVGVVTHLDMLRAYGLRMLVVIVAATWVGIVVSALVLASLLHRGGARGDKTPAVMALPGPEVGGSAADDQAPGQVASTAAPTACTLRPVQGG